MKSGSYTFAELQWQGNLSFATEHSSSVHMDEARYNYFKILKCET